MRSVGTHVITAMVSLVSAVSFAVAESTTLVRAAEEAARPVPPGSFVRLDSSGLPARWDPCVPLRWKIAGTRPSARLRMVTSDAMRQIESATGLRFVFAGRATATEFARPPRNTIVIGSSSNLGVVNAGGTASLLYEESSAGSLSIIGARVVINPVVVRTGTKLSWMLRPIVLHEVGHAIGLAHVSNPSEIMYPQVVRAFEYTVLARRVLVELGASKGCMTRVQSGG